MNERSEPSAAAVPVRDPAPASSRAFGALGALFCAVAVALGAYAAHAADATAGARLQTASLYLFLHGIALLALQPQLRGRGRLLAAGTLALGALLFAGSLAGGALLGWPTRLAPTGGTLMIAGWISWALLQLSRVR